MNAIDASNQKLIFKTLANKLTYQTKNVDFQAIGNIGFLQKTHHTTDTFIEAAKKRQRTANRNF